MLFTIFYRYSFISISRLIYLNELIFLKFFHDFLFLRPQVFFSFLLRFLFLFLILQLLLYIFKKEILANLLSILIVKFKGPLIIFIILIWILVLFFFIFSIHYTFILFHLFLKSKAFNLYQFLILFLFFTLLFLYFLILFINLFLPILIII